MKDILKNKKKDISGLILQRAITKRWFDKLIDGIPDEIKNWEPEFLPDYGGGVENSTTEEIEEHNKIINSDEYKENKKKFANFTLNIL